MSHVRLDEGRQAVATRGTVVVVGNASGPVDAFTALESRATTGKLVLEH